MSSSKYKLTTALVIASGSVLGLSTPLPAQETKDVTIFLEQGWTEEDRQTYYHTSQGSAMLPRVLYNNIEQADSETLVNTDEFATRYGLVPSPKDDKFNPDGMPIGLSNFVVDEGFFRGDWTGVTCAACHNGQLYYKGKQIRIDGGVNNQFDLLGYAAGLRDAVTATLNYPDKFQRFIDRLKGKIDIGPNQVRVELEEIEKRLKYYTDYSTVAPYNFGPGRMDALSIIHNVVLSADMDIPENGVVTIAPTKPPFVWNAPQSAWVQWTAFQPNALLRNVGESIGVLVRANLTAPTVEQGLFDSTINIQGQIDIEKTLRKLSPPKWPEDIFGPLDPEKVAKGKELVGQFCTGCHSVWPHRWSDPRLAGKRFIENALIPLDYVGTDGMQFKTAPLDPLPVYFSGITADYLPAPFTGKQTAPQGVILQDAIVTKVLEKALSRLDISQAELEDAWGYSAPGSLTPPAQPVYKSAPLEGMWAAGPFLHNGSVPTMYDLLSAVDERPKKFKVGREFDPVKLGIDTTTGDFEFDTTLPGSSNAGHSYEDGELGNGIVGPKLSEDDKWAIIEYMKSIPTEAAQTTPYGGPENPALAWDDPTFFNANYGEVYTRQNGKMIEE